MAASRGKDASVNLLLFYQANSNAVNRYVKKII